MKKIYAEPILVISEFSTEDIMTLSKTQGDGDTYSIDLPV